MKNDFEIQIRSQPKITVTFYRQAYKKMKRLVHNFNTEIRWQGTVDRVSDTEFVVKDIMVYPQTVTGRTVKINPEKYGEWLCSLPDEIFSKLRFQGHSHVNMSPTPSGVDHRQMEDTYKTLQGDDFYIHIIVNKSNRYWIQIYDNKSKTIFRNREIEIVVEDENILDFVEEAKKNLEVYHYEFKQEP